jgi:phosphatidylserine/phosphatidylglycerophosphate/cardiolipin synthase-like enzyme
MSDLDRAIAKLAMDLHPDRLVDLAAAMAKAGDGNVAAVLASNAAGIPSGHLLRIAKAWQADACSGAELAARLRTAAAVGTLASSLSSTELVWTGPSSGLVAVRHTEQVLTGLIDGAQRRIFLISFVAYNVASVIDALASAARRGVRISVLMERSEATGGNVTTDSLGLIRSKVPRAACYEWDQNVGGEQFTGASVHAKCAVADGRDAFITSANLTGAAMERNMEAGVLLRGGPLPAQLERHLFALIATKHLKAV